MAKTMNVTLLLVVLVAAATVLPGTQAVDHVVGGATGWNIPSNGESFYTTWSAGNNFSVGDVLVFTFTTGVHDVATVSKAAYDACTTTSPLSLTTTGPANIQLNTTGENYFICTISTHCSNGQKLAVNVKASNESGTSPPSPPGSTPPPPPPPPPSGASASSPAATLPLILMTVASAIFYDLF